MAGPENGNLPLLYVIKMSLPRGWVVLKSLKTPLRNIKMGPNGEPSKAGTYGPLFWFLTKVMRRQIYSS